MVKNVLIVGDGSYLADGIENYLAPFNVERIHHLDGKDFDFFRNFDFIINFGIQFDFSKRIFDVNELIDVQLAKILKGSSTKLIMLSSRRVYGNHKELRTFQESDDLLPTDYYSTNKIKAEEELRNILPNQHLILRIGNILGLPVNRVGYHTFMGWISGSIRNNGFLFVTENPLTKKDFISKEYLHKAISELIKREVTGTINVGSGFAIPLKELLENICGKEHIIYDNNLPEPQNQFILDVKKLSQYVEAFTYEGLITKCREIQVALYGF